MTGKSRKLAVMMQRRKVNILYVQEPRWKDNKAIRLKTGFKMVYHDVDGKTNE